MVIWAKSANSLSFVDLAFLKGVEYCKLADGKWQKLGYQNSKTPEPNVTKFGVSKYVGDINPHAKLQCELHSGFVLANKNVISPKPLKLLRPVCSRGCGMLLLD